MSRRKRYTRRRSQPYDTTLKELVQNNPQTIVPMLLPGAVYQETLNVEAIRPTFRADKVFKVMYRRQECIFHLEFQSSEDDEIGLRLLSYSVILHRDHRLPVISMVVYLFQVKLPEPPYQISVGLDGTERETILTFAFKVLPLFAEDAVKYVQNHVASMYPLLPAMQHVNRILIRQALDELVALYNGDETELARQITWMKLLLERTDTIPAIEKRQIQEELHMFDRLVNESPWLRQMRDENRNLGLAEGIQRGLEEGRAEGELRNARRMVLDIVEVRFPTLIDNAQLRVDHTNNVEVLRDIGRKLVAAADVAEATRIISALSS